MATAADARDKTHWHKTMNALPIPAKGCHKATYPQLKWIEVPCTTARETNPTSPSPKVQAAAVGGSTPDLAAMRPPGSTTTIRQAQGSFDSVVTTGETNRSAGPNGVNTRRSEFELQLNTNTFNSPACGTVQGCTGWEQFLLNNDPGSPPAQLQIQSWLLGFLPSGGNCPAPFKPSGSNCFFATAVVNVDIQNIQSLVTLIMTATAEANGNDTVSIFGTGEDAIFAVTADSPLSLAPNWTQAEFNVFGDESRHIAVFDPNSALVVRVTTDIVEGTTQETPVPAQVSLTGESNTLSLVGSGCSIPSPFFAVTFKESNIAGDSYKCPVNPPVLNLCADATEEVAYDQKALSTAQQAFGSPSCAGPESFACSQTIKSLQQKLQRDEATKAADCK